MRLFGKQRSESVNKSVNKIFLSPHNDDETLWGSFTIQRNKPTVAVVFDSYIQVARGNRDCNAETRRNETRLALRQLGLESEPIFLGFRDDEMPSPNTILARLEQHCCKSALWWKGVELWAPAHEDGGHDQHNLVAAVAKEMVYGEAILRESFLSYTRTGGKSTHGTEVKPTGEMVLKKLQALACYKTQISIDALGCWPHFMDLREFSIE